MPNYLYNSKWVTAAPAATATLTFVHQPILLQLLKVMSDPRQRGWGNWWSKTHYKLHVKSTRTDHSM